MGICTSQLRDYVIKPTLKLLGVHSKAAENLLLGTAAQESGLGFHLKQKRQHGIGLYQISPQRHTKIWDTYLVQFPELASQVRGLASQHEFLDDPHAELATNLRYATAIAWMIYQQTEIQLPQQHNDIAALAQLWAHSFHCRPGGNEKLFIQHYKDFMNEAILAA